jgi:hypothetical protein
MSLLVAKVELIGQLAKWGGVIGMSLLADDSAPQASDPRDDSLVKSRKRVADHGEVFTPSWMVEDMLNLVKNESERIDSRFLEPACGSGNFLVPVLQRKLGTVELKYGKDDFEKRHQALFGLMCIYGIELLQDNAEECRVNLVEVFDDYLGSNVASDWHDAARAVVHANIIEGDALEMSTSGGEPIVFPEWAYLTKGKFSRRDFSYANLTQRADANAEDSIFQHFAEHDIFTPVREYSQMTVSQVAASIGPEVR